MLERKVFLSQVKVCDMSNLLEPTGHLLHMCREDGTQDGVLGVVPVIHADYTGHFLPSIGGNPVTVLCGQGPRREMGWGQKQHLGDALDVGVDSQINLQLHW